MKHPRNSPDLPLNQGSRVSRTQSAGQKRLRFLFDLTHPAAFHLFRYVVQDLRAKGHSVAITCRPHPTLLALLQWEGQPFVPLTSMRKGVLGLAYEFVWRGFALLRMAQRYRPDVLVAKHGVSVSYVGTVLGIPSVSFEDTAHARLQRLLSRPFARHVFTEACYSGYAGSKQWRYPSLNVLAYLHPNHFTPDPSVLRQAGLAHDESYIVVRFVAWDAAHDMGLRRDRDEERRRMLLQLSRIARVVVVPEKSLPADMMHYVPALPPHRFHDLLALAAAHVGEGGATAAEAAVLGVPTVYTNPLVVDMHRELSRYGLVEWRTDPARAVDLVRTWMRDPRGAKKRFDACRRQLLDRMQDPVPLLVSQLTTIARRRIEQRKSFGSRSAS